MSATPDAVVTVLGSIVVLATVTTLVLPGRGTGTVVTSFGTQFANAIRAAMGSPAQAPAK